MFIPFNDKNPLRHIPFQFVTVSLIAINILEYVFLQSGIFASMSRAVFLNVTLVPAELISGANVTNVPAILPEQLTLFTYMFLHGGWMHLLSNMLFLWIFGDNIEDAMGHMRFLVFYLLCGAAAGIAHSLAAPTSTAPLIGASGAIAGVTGAYLMLYPRVKIWVLVFMRIPIRLPAIWLLSAWFALQVFNVVMDPASNVAWWAHIGGFIAGAILVVFFKRSSVPLFGAAPH